LAREAGYRMLEGHACSALAEIQLACGQPDQALEHAREALAILADAGATPKADASTTSW
jgi:hypothetical protein